MSDDVRKEFQQLLNTFKHVTGGLKVYSELNEVEKESMWKGYLAAHASQQARIDALEAKLSAATKRQREADLLFIRKAGRQLPATCQQKAIQQIVDQLKGEELVGL